MWWVWSHSWLCHSPLQKDNLLILDLLWRYYEKNKVYAGAAKILDELAHKEE